MSRATAGNFGRPLHEVEQEEFSWDHAQAGAWMARNWALPDVLACCIGLHHTPLHQIHALGFLKTPVAAVAIASPMDCAPPSSADSSAERRGLAIGRSAGSSPITASDVAPRRLAVSTDPGAGGTDPSVVAGIEK